ncbi:MAG: DUF1579 family protein [Fibrella sp.]|nr:DUF1579 family protein [Armatimonadota bacterium]
MKLTALQDQLTGDWVGKSTLWCNWLPEPEKETSSESRLSVKTVARGKFLSFAYTWSLAGNNHEGFLLTGNENDSETTSGAWGDSWHQSGSLLVLKGSVAEAGAIELNGTFEAPPDPDWGWRITITQPTPQELQMMMYVIPWNGTPERAVQADYVRA